MKNGHRFTSTTITKLKEFFRKEDLDSTELGRAAKDSFDFYITKYRPHLASDYVEYFTEPNFLTLQTKEMIDIILGLDVLLQDFFSNIEHPGIQRHHTYRDKNYYCVFEMEGNSYKIKLLPLSSRRHMQLHANYKFHGNWYGYRVDNDLAKARVKHLYEIIQRQYETGKNYEALLLAEFNSRVDTIGGNKLRIWDGFREDILIEWIGRWEDRKKMNDDEWHIKYYSEFYSNRYINSLYTANRYLGGKNVDKIEFWDWYFREYLVNNIYPIIE